MHSTDQMIGQADTGGRDIRNLLRKASVEGIGAALVRRRLINPKALQAAEMESTVTGARVGQILVRNGLLAQKDLIEAILETAPEELASERVSHPRIPSTILRKHKILLAAETADQIFVATSGSERQVEMIVATYYPDKTIAFVAFDPFAMAEFITRVEMNFAKDPTDIREDERLDELIYRAYDMGASDIHIVPKARSYTVFFRILGERQIVYEGPSSEYRSMRAQIKNRAAMDIAEDRVPQDGVFQVDFSTKAVDFRVVSIPVLHGEALVLRVLDPDSIKRNLDLLGISRVGQWRRGFNQMNGLCIVCGPTGSGKTTTLNATISELDRFGKAVYTVEDPVEYPISYAGQVSINPAVGLDYPRALRAFMRGDPDIINIGEVRDEETAATMVRAAETGHMVLATLHASSIRGAISRLEYLGVPERDLRWIVRSVLVQNLVRTLCPQCGGAGCPRCFESGYGGRTIVSECQSFDGGPEWEAMIAGKTDWPTIIEDAVDLLEKGRTDLRELDRVYGPKAHEEVGRRQGSGAG